MAIHIFDLDGTLGEAIKIINGLGVTVRAWTKAQDGLSAVSQGDIVVVNGVALEDGRSVPQALMSRYMAVPVVRINADVPYHPLVVCDLVGLDDLATAVLNALALSHEVPRCKSLSRRLRLA